MKNVRRHHSSVWMDGCLLTTGGEEQQKENSRKLWKNISHHEEFSLKEGVKERKELPIVFRCHKATKFDHHKMIVCGGEVLAGVSYPFSKL